MVGSRTASLVPTSDFRKGSVQRGFTDSMASSGRYQMPGRAPTRLIRAASAAMFGNRALPRLQWEPSRQPRPPSPCRRRKRVGCANSWRVRRSPRCPRESADVNCDRMRNTSCSRHKRVGPAAADHRIAGAQSAGQMRMATGPHPTVDSLIPRRADAGRPAARPPRQSEYRV